MCELNGNCTMQGTLGCSGCHKNMTETTMSGPLSGTLGCGGCDNTQNLPIYVVIGFGVAMLVAIAKHTFINKEYDIMEVLVDTGLIYLVSFAILYYIFMNQRKEEV